ncbi:MAG: type II toxin-antitoxin system Phd/YefM family antitoxin [Gemmatimonadota bacterium]
MSVQVATGSYIPAMRTVGLKVLKNRLSEYIRLVVAGETILITDRDRVVAELRPPALAHPMMADALLADMVARGILTLPTVVGGGAPPRLPVANADEILADLDASRADR